MPGLPDLPVELVLDNLLPALPVPDLLHLGGTSRSFATLVDDDTFWKRKLQTDFNFTGEGTARTSGWKFIYKGLSKPRVFVWGEGSHGRLGLPGDYEYRDVPAPVELQIPGARIVSLVAGGMSFNAIDSDGNVYVWGTLDGTSYALERDPFTTAGKRAPTPLRLELPAPVRSLSCGRLHTAALAADLSVYTFLAWGMPYRLATPRLALAGPDTTPAQVESGWHYSAVLTQAGDVLVWWPSEEQGFEPEQGERYGSELRTAYEKKWDELKDRMDAGEIPKPERKKAADGGVDTIPCHVWDLPCDPLRLPGILAGDLPDLSPALAEQPAGDRWTRGPATKTLAKLVKIAALDNVLIGLTDQGHVLKFDGLTGAESAERGQWEYLPEFSEAERVKNHPTFTEIEPPTSMRITHISGHFNTFAAYSPSSGTTPTSIVLTGKADFTPSTPPSILPALQHRDIIALVLGDYHFGALTAKGRLLTWGQYSRGALGLGDPKTLEVGAPGGFAEARLREAVRVGGRRIAPPNVEVPSEVRFDWGFKERRERFCFQAAAAGWHTGALVIDLDPGAEELDTGIEEVDMPGRFSGQPPASSSGGGCFPLPGVRPAHHSQIVSHTFAPFVAAPGPVIPQTMPPTVAEERQQQQQQQQGQEQAGGTPGFGRGLRGGLRIGFAGRGRGMGPRGVAPDRGNPL